MSTVLAIRHIPFEGLDLFEAVLSERGHTIRYVEAQSPDLPALMPLEDDLWVILGGPMGVYETDQYAFLGHELRLLAARLKADRPTLGICLGAQLMAAALGARVYPGGRKEIGWKPVQLTAAGLHSPLAPLADQLPPTPVLHWHGDTFNLPQAATLLASTDIYPHQAFQHGRAALALQFHLETSGAGLERWFVGHAEEIAQTDQVDLATLRADTQRCAPTAEAKGQQCLVRWLETVGL